MSVRKLSFDELLLGEMGDGLVIRICTNVVFFSYMRIKYSPAYEEIFSIRDQINFGMKIMLLRIEFTLLK